MWMDAKILLNFIVTIEITFHYVWLNKWFISGNWLRKSWLPSERVEAAPARCFPILTTCSPGTRTKTHPKLGPQRSSNHTTLLHSSKCSDLRSLLYLLFLCCYNNNSTHCNIALKTFSVIDFVLQQTRPIVTILQ